MTKSRESHNFISLQAKAPDLMMELSEQEQESVSAGFGVSYFFLAHEVISTSASDYTEFQSTLPNSEIPTVNGRTSQNTNFESQRITLAMGGWIPISSVASFIEQLIQFF